MREGTALQIHNPSIQFISFLGSISSPGPGPIGDPVMGLKWGFEEGLLFLLPQALVSTR